MKLFDRHRVGVHEYTFEEGLRMEPMREDGRRCLHRAEMEERGWGVNERGRWFDPSRAEVGLRLRGVSREAPV